MKLDDLRNGDEVTIVPMSGIYPLYAYYMRFADKRYIIGKLRNGNGTPQIFYSEIKPGHSEIKDDGIHVGRYNHLSKPFCRDGNLIDKARRIIRNHYEKQEN